MRWKPAQYAPDVAVGIKPILLDSSKDIITEVTGWPIQSQRMNNTSIWKGTYSFSGAIAGTTFS